MEATLKQINEILRLWRWSKIPLIGVFYRNRLKDEIMDAAIKGGAFYTLKDKFSPFIDAFSLYAGLQESIYTAIAKVLMGLPQDLLLCPLCYESDGKKVPLKVTVGDNEAEVIECDRHGTLCVYTPDQEYLPLMRLIIACSDENIEIPRLSIRAVTHDQLYSAENALMSVRTTSDLLAGKEIGEIVRKIYDMVAEKLEDDSWWSEKEIETVARLTETLRGLIDKYSSLVRRVMVKPMENEG